MDRGAWWAAVHGGHKESDTSEATKHTRGKVTANISHKERGCLCQERVPKDTVTERVIFYFLSETLNKRCCLTWICAICVCPIPLSKIISSLFVELAPNLVPKVLS